MKTKFTLGIAFIAAGLLNGCIENDVDYPYVSGNIEQIEVEGMVSSASINRTAKTVTIQIGDEYDIQNLTVTRLMVENDARIYPDADKCIDAKAFPETGFASLDSIPESANTKINFSTPVNVLVQTYQDYNWTITINQNWDNIIAFEGITDAGHVFDYENHQLLVYVDEGTNLSELRIEDIQFKSIVEEVLPNPYDITDFSRPVTLDVTYFGRTEKWTVNVVYGTNIEPSASIFPMSTRAIVSGVCRSKSEVTIEYNRRGDNDWKTIEFKTDGTSFTYTVTDLIPYKYYDFRILVNGETLVEGNEGLTRTATAEELPNGSFDGWSRNQSPEYYCPWAAGDVQYWGTGNRAVSIISSTDYGNSTPDSDQAVSGYSARLETKVVAGMKLAAGNIFAGEFVGIEDATHGVLSFGQQFVSFPTGIKFHYKYTSKEINRCDDTSSLKPSLEAMFGRADSCHVYWALTDWDTPLRIRTSPDKRQLVDVNDPNIIAYGEFITGETTDDFKPKVELFEYRDYRTPRYLMIVATSSKYGDYYTGGIGSTLWLDEMELIYD